MKQIKWNSMRYHTTRWLVFLWVCCFSSMAYAEPEMLRLDYFSCSGCHYSPRGGGLLTSYGKGIAQALSLKEGEYEESELKQKMNFNGLMDQAIQLRLAGVLRMGASRAFPMQADYLNHLQLSRQFSINSVIGKVPSRPVSQENSKDTPEALQEIILRKMLLSYRPLDDGMEIVLGRDVLPIGIGLDDHTAYIKENNRLDIDDVVTQVGIYLWGRQFMTNVIGFGPNPQDAENNGESGLSASLEYKPWLHKNYTIGGHVLKGSTEAIDRTLTGVISRLSFAESITILLEVDHTSRELKTEGFSFEQWTQFVKAGFFPRDFWETSVAWEKLDRETPFDMALTKVVWTNSVRMTENLNLILLLQNQVSTSGSGYLTMFQLFYNWF
ncbi:hypothetical protein WDW89_23685 [Deltaproteobacteria bacterium TL4]